MSRPSSGSPASRAPLWRAVITLGVLALCAFLVWNNSARLGLDLKGGTQIVLETQDTERVQADAESTDRALQILRGRVDALGVAEPTLARSGERRIIVELPGLQDPRQAAEVIGKTAQLSFHEVLRPATPQDQKGAGDKGGAGNKDNGKGDDSDRTTGKSGGDDTVLKDEGGQPLKLGPTLVDGNGVDDANAAQPENSIGQWVVNVGFNGEGSPGWKKLVDQACANQAGGRRIAIVLDNEIISSPAVQPDLCAGGGGSSTQISGDFSQKAADDLAVLIKGGALPVPVKTISQSTVGPTLGADAIDASVKAGIIGVLLTGLFIAFVYRVMGLMATIGLATYALVSYAMLVWVGATLTLPGLAGFVLAIGLAIDANVLVFERAREEYDARRGEGLAPALDTGYRKAWTAILDSNVTTVLAAALLFFLASGPVKGFGVTLTIGTVASMFSALVVARVLTDWAVRRSFVKKRPAMTGITNTGRVRKWLTESGPNLMRRSNIWIAVTAAITVVAIGGIVVRGLNLGLEFTGGRLLEYSTSQTVSASEARAAVTDAGFPTAVVQTSSGENGGGENITVRVGQISNDEAVEIEQALDPVGGEVTKQRDELIGPSLGDELRNKAVIAFLIAISAQLIYLAFRFRWTYAGAAVISIVTDVTAVVGIFAWWGKPIDGVFLAAILSIIGLSVNDTIVVFDRIRERRRDNPTRPLAEVTNEAILQTIPRTINTGLGAMFILAALAVLGGDTLTDFALALLIGLTIGSFSSIITASPLMIFGERRWPFREKNKAQASDPYSHVGAAGRESGSL
ncbi:MAG: protein translocase subunit SecD [Nocardioidaceae bacterium]